jgi:hypothetical protein
VRRLVKHGIAGVGFVALTVSAAVAALGSPASLGTADAIPATTASVVPAGEPTATESAIADALAGARAARESRDAERAKLDAATAKRASKRATTLSAQTKLIAAQQARLEAQQARQLKAEAVAKARRATEAKAAADAKAKAKAKAAAAAKARALKNRGYQPGTTDPRDIARQILKNKYGYGADQYSCFNFIIMRESMWDVHATNRSSGAYGIPQALPGSKMSTIASDWRTNPATQIIWGIEYMKSRYGSPCQAKSFKASHGWY